MLADLDFTPQVHENTSYAYLSFRVQGYKNVPDEENWGGSSI